MRSILYERAPLSARPYAQQWTKQGRLVPGRSCRFISANRLNAPGPPHAALYPRVSSSSRARKIAWPFKIFGRASARSNHSARSSSGNHCRRPDRGGHSISNVLLLSEAASQLPSTAHTCTSFPPGCLASPSGRNLPCGAATRLFVKLALGSGKGCFAFCDQSFRDRPGSKVLVAPERTAWMTQQNFNAVGLAPVEEKPGALCAERLFSLPHAKRMFAVCRLRRKWRRSFASGMALRTRPGGTPPLRAISTPQCM